MAYDGLAVSAGIKEFRERLIGGKISKIIQPEKDEIQLIIRRQKEQLRLKISVNPSLPLCCLTDSKDGAPMTAPGFCMALRKHIGNGTLISVHQPSQNIHEDGLERVIIFEIEHLDEMGDMGRRFLSVELMGKYSNIILLREDYNIIDSIKRISLTQSSVREVLPNRRYFIPDAMNKLNPLNVEEAQFIEALRRSPEPVFKALFHSFTGLSPLSSGEICYRAGIDPDIPGSAHKESSLSELYRVFSAVIDEAVKSSAPSPCLLYKNEVPQDFSAISLTMYHGSHGYREQPFGSMSELIELFYSEKDRLSRIRQRSSDLRKQLGTLLERAAKKLSLQEKQLADTEKKDSFRIYGELINTYGYSLSGGESELVCENYYDGKEIRIPLIPELSARDNSKKYFERYEKLKRTRENLNKQLKDSKQELLHLQSILTALDMAEGEGDLREIRREMMEYGFIKKSSGGGKEKLRSQDKSRPYHFLSSHGYHIYVGRNNFQNELVSFRLADGGDLWLHAKGVTGSHVIVKTGGADFEELPDSLFEEAAALAAYFSSHSKDSKVEVDYTYRKNLRKVPNAAPGFVIYHSNYSITVAPGKKLSELRD